MVFPGPELGLVLQSTLCVVCMLPDASMEWVAGLSPCRAVTRAYGQDLSRVHGYLRSEHHPKSTWALLCRTLRCYLG